MSETYKLANGTTVTIPSDSDTVVYESNEAFQATAVARFGESPRCWRFRCSTCGHEASVQDFMDLAPPGSPTEDLQRWGARAGQQCYGRALLDAGRGVHARDVPARGKKDRYGVPASVRKLTEFDGLPIIGSFGSHSPCDWSTGGLFGGGNTLVRAMGSPDDDPRYVWAFAFGTPAGQDATS